jgi:integrase
MGRKARRTVSWGKRAIAELPKPETGRDVYAHARVQGLQLVVTDKGARIFYWRFRTLDGRQERVRLGDFPAMTPQAAVDAVQGRKETADTPRLVGLAERVAQGENPAAKRREARKIPTLESFWTDTFLPHLRHAGRRERTLQQYQDTWRNHLEKPLGRKRLHHITRRDVVEMHNASGQRAPRAANLALAVLRSMLNHARDREILEGANPCDRVRKFPERARERYLTEAEIARLYQALEADPDTDLHDIVKLLLLTGARRGNVLSMRWADVDPATGVWTVPQAATKTHKVYRIRLTRGALAILQRRRQMAEKGAVYVFPGRRPGTHVSGIKRGWGRVRAAAGLHDVRLHDLRHTTASLMINSGASLAVVGAQLGHANQGTTARYAHLVQDTVAEALERATAGIGVVDSTQVIPIESTSD